VLGRQTIKKHPTFPGEFPLIGGDSPNLHSGTVKRLAASFPDTFQRSSQVASRVTHKT